MHYTYILCINAKRRAIVECMANDWTSMKFLKYYANNMLIWLLQGHQTVYIYAIYRVYIEIMTLRPCKDTSCALMTTCTYIQVYNIIVVLINFILRVWICSKRFVSLVCRANFEIRIIIHIGFSNTICSQKLWFLLLQGWWLLWQQQPWGEVKPFEIYINYTFY